MACIHMHEHMKEAYKINYLCKMVNLAAIKVICDPRKLKHPRILHGWWFFRNKCNLRQKVTREDV